MPSQNLITGAQNTWCPGCGNFSIQFALRNTIQSLVADGIPLENIVLETGIGCHAKMVDYLEINSFYSIHGRTIPVATGIKLANPDLTVLCCAGDGDAYAEGLDHLIFAAKRNADITVIIHNKSLDVVCQDITGVILGEQLLTGRGVGVRSASERYLGQLATAMRRWGVAEAHFEHALRLDERTGATPWLAHSRYQYGRMLRLRGRPEDRDRVEALIGHALATARELGMQGLAERIGNDSGDGC